MNVSVNWLSDLLDRPVDPADAARRLTMAGAEVDVIEPLHQDLRDVIVAEVAQVEKHPDADRLTVCRVNYGNGVAEVVCGAPNVRAGRKYPFAPVGTTLPGGITLTARKIRGVTSQGMLCSAKELGLGADHEGILELDTTAAAGTPLLEAVRLSDHRIVLELTPNRPDLLCHKGVARELGAVYEAPVKLPQIPGAARPELKVETGKAGSVDGVDVVIEDIEGCPRYMAASIRGVKVGPSPPWLQARLRAIDARPVNNVVDATNYVMFELNHPLHAFDRAKLGSRIVVRRANPGETLRTLDGEDRALTADMTAICDANRPVAVAGVMGGADTEVTAATTDIVLECAYFDPKRIRATRKTLNMSTDASYRFERGIDLDGLPGAVRRAVEVIVATSGGEAVPVVADVYPTPVAARTVFLRPTRVSHLLGVEVPRPDIEAFLSSVGFAVAPKDDRFAVQVPGWRPDVTREVDLIEEVARLRGYDTFPVELGALRPSTVPDDPAEIARAGLRQLLTAVGLHEARTLPMGGAPKNEPAPVRVVNPMSSEEAHLRASLLPGLERAVRHNWSVRERDIRLFEIGTVFRSTGERALPVETCRIAAVVSGNRAPAHWSAGQMTPDYDGWDLKGLVTGVASTVSPGSAVEPHPEGGARWLVRAADGAVLGGAEELPVEPPAWAAPVYGFELDVASNVPPRPRFEALPATPPLERDLALVLAPAVTAEQVEDVVRQFAGPLLERVVVFDEYRAEALKGRSVAWRLVFRAPDRTLRDQEVDAVLKRVLAALEEQLGVRLRQA